MKFREHEINSFNNFIMGWYAEDTSFCDELIDIHQKDEEQLNYTGVYGSGKVNKEIKDSVDCGFKPSMMDVLLYGNVLKSCLDLYNERYPHSACSGYSVQEGFAVQYYPPGGGYKVWHCERESSDMMNVTRHLTFMTYLNNVTDEGGTEFYYQGVKIRPDKGLTLIWPADWMFTHRGVVSPTQEKYIVTGWMNLLKEGQLEELLKEKL